MASPKLPPQRRLPKGRVIGLCTGTFDLLHEGHRHLLRAARSRCDQLIVAIDSDRRARALKGPGRPVEDEAVRSQNLVASGLVDLVVAVDSDSQLLDAIRYYEPDFLFAGTAGDAQRIEGPKTIDTKLAQTGAMLALTGVMLLPLLPGYSTTAQIKERLQ